MLIWILARDINLASNRNYESGYIFFIKVNILDKMTNRLDMILNELRLIFPMEFTNISGLYSLIII